MSGKGTYKMSIKILQLRLVLCLTFKGFAEFSLSSVAQLLKLRLQTKRQKSVPMTGRNFLI